MDYNYSHMIILFNYYITFIFCLD